MGLQIKSCSSGSNCIRRTRICHRGIVKMFLPQNCIEYSYLLSACSNIYRGRKSTHFFGRNACFLFASANLDPDQIRYVGYWLESCQKNCGTATLLKCKNISLWSLMDVVRVGKGEFWLVVAQLLRAQDPQLIQRRLQLLKANTDYGTETHFRMKNSKSVYRNN